MNPAYKTTIEEAVALDEVVDSLSFGIFVVGFGGAIVHANAEGRAILTSSDILCTVNGRLLATDPQNNPPLRDALIAATIDRASVVLSLTSKGGMRHVVRVLPLRASDRRAAVFVTKATFERSSCPDIIQRAYRLTPMELRVLLAIVDSCSVSEVAASLGIAISTVKTHLGRLFSKTGTNRQADLVKLVAAFSHRLVA